VSLEHLQLCAQYVTLPVALDEEKSKYAGLGEKNSLGSA
jgi:hypothetical protein